MGVRPPTLARVAFLAAACPSFGWAAAYPLCTQIREFEAASFPDANQQSRRWIEVHWRGVWLDFDNPRRISCTHSTDTPSAKLCDWIERNPGSIEFSDFLPRAILVCHGYRFPDRSYWSRWQAEIQLRGQGNNVPELQIDLGAHNTPDVGIRLSVFPEGADEATAPLPPMFKRSEAAPDNPDEAF